MKKLVIAAALALSATSAAAQYQMTYYLVAQWYENGNQMCRYGNGTVLNMGYRTCPLSIKG
jgi:Spy/CpxP family protein refolding chaperone